MKNKFLGIVCFIYCFIICYVILTNHLDNYIAPNMQIYIKLSIIPLFIVGLVLIFNNKFNYKFKISDLVLVIPLMLIFFAGDGNLTHAIAKVKMTNKKSDNIEVMYDVDYELSDKEDTVESNKKIEEFYFDIEDSLYSYLSDYLTYMKGAAKYIGKTIKIKGFAVDFGDYLTSDYFALGKYAITCCAADAEFSGMIIKYPKDKIKYGKWYQVEGVLELGKDSEGYNVMTINPVKVEEIEKGKESEYVYSCDTYGSGACEKLLDYDLEY